MPMPRRAGAAVSRTRERVVLGLAAAVIMVTLTPASASAKTSPIQLFGGVRCSFTATVGFSPRINDSGGGTSHSLCGRCSRAARRARTSTPSSSAGRARRKLFPQPAELRHTLRDAGRAHRDCQVAEKRIRELPATARQGDRANDHQLQYHDGRIRRRRHDDRPCFHRHSFRTARTEAIRPPR
jgi:hypothetical protein